MQTSFLSSRSQTQCKHCLVFQSFFTVTINASFQLFFRLFVQFIFTVKHTKIWIFLLTSISKRLLSISSQV